jgi:hypothetical protein
MHVCVCVHRLPGGTQTAAPASLARKAFGRGITLVLQWYCSGVTVVSQWVLQWSYRGATMVLQWCYGNVTVVHSIAKPQPKSNLALAGMEDFLSSSPWCHSGVTVVL